MKKMYKVRDEYADRWFGSEFPEPIDEDEVQRLAKEWGLTEEDLAEQLEEL